MALRYGRSGLVSKGGVLADVSDIPPLEGLIGYRFASRSLLREALSHKSFASEVGTRSCNERLEFLGDSVLSAVVAHRLYEDYPNEDEGRLSKKKSRIVSRLSLARWASRLNLGEYLYLGVGEESSGGRLRPSLLGNALEALIGAVYLDGGYLAAEKFIRSLLEQEGEVEESDYKSELQEYAQKEFHLMPAYALMSMTGPEHDKTFEVEVSVGRIIRGVGCGKNKKAAEQKAAQEALKSIKTQSPKRARGGENHGL